MGLFSRKPDLAFEVDVPQEMLEAMTFGGAVAPRISRTEALQVPAVLRSRNLIAGTLAQLPVHILDKKNRESLPTTLLEQIDPDQPNVVTFAQTYEDLLFEGISWWRVTDFGFHGYPTFAEHINVSRVHISGVSMPIVDGTQSLNPQVGKVFIDGLPVPDDQVIRFDSPNPPLLRHAARAIRTCLQLDTTAANYATDPVPLGYFTPTEGSRKIYSKEEIEAFLDQWSEARRRRAWGYVPAMIDGKQFQFNAEQIQLADQRQHAVLEIARAAGIDPEDLGVSTTSRTYQNSEQRRQDLIDFTMSPYIAAVEQRLSMKDVTPRGYQVKVNLDGFLRGDTKGRMEAYAIGKPLGAYTTEEIRDLEQRPPLKPSEMADIGPQQLPEQNGNAPTSVEEINRALARRT